MDNLIRKYNISIFKDPLPVVYEEIPSLEKALTGGFFVRSHYDPSSFDKMFPLYAPLPPKFSLIFIQTPKSIFSVGEFIDDILAEKSLRLVGIHGILLLGKYHLSAVVPDGTCFYSPAYPFKQENVQDGTNNEPLIPYFYREENDEEIVIKYSRTTPGHIHPNMRILLGQISE